MSRIVNGTLGLFALTWGCALWAETPATLTIHVNKPGPRISPTLYGVFFEEINRAGEGGLYAEMAQNRGVEDAPAPVGWTLVKSAGAEGAMALDKSRPLNANNPTSLRLEIARTGGGRVGVANEGFKGAPYPQEEDPAKWLPEFEKALQASRNGMAVERGKEYRLSFHARCDGRFSGPLTAGIEKQDGTAIASSKIDGIGAEWKKFECWLKAGASDSNARLVLSATRPGTIWFDVVSLFPKDTFKGRENGMRADLARMIVDMKPAFIRFPGGCYVEGAKLANAFRWKKTIGDIAERPGHWNLWGYYSNDGLGYHEYLQFCEDVGAEPLFVINCGMSHEEQRGNRKDLIDEIGEYVQDALDAIEYANGPAGSQWGALRAKAVHPAPFNLTYMEIGNENGGPMYDKCYQLFYDAIKTKYPQMRLIANDHPVSRPMDIRDEHSYNSPLFFMTNAGKYDKYERGGPKIYVGEYAVTRGAGNGNLLAAVGEAAFMTGMERNADVVAMCSYAPLFASIEWKRWNPDAIVFDSSRVFGTPSYHVQALFANNRADTVLPLDVESPMAEIDPPGGMIGVGAWNTQAEFKDIKVTQGDKVLFESDFTKGRKDWQTAGVWKTEGGVLRCLDESTKARAVAGNRDWNDYTLTLKARKIAGKEGFLVMFRLKNIRDKCWWNIGGWGNKRHALEAPGIRDAGVPGAIETGRWYDIGVELKGPSIRCYLDGKLIREARCEPIQALYGTAGCKDDTGEVILKVVNVSKEAIPATVKLQGAGAVASTGKTIVLTAANSNDENSFDQPFNVAPKEETFQDASASFRHRFPPCSVTALRLNVK